MENETTRKRMISHSEVESFNQCEMKHHFGFVDKLQPIERSAALNKGTMGHLFLETFLKGIKNGESDWEAKTNATTVILQADAMLASEVILIVHPWVDYVWPNLGWKIIEVEYEFEPVHLGNGLYLPGKIDAIVETKDSRFGNAIAIVDHKFVYDPPTKAIENLQPQIPKYIGVLRTLGIPAKFGIYNYLRTRKLKDPMDKFSRSNVYPNNERLKTHMIEHMETARQIDAGVTNPVRTANKMNCGHCGFLELCTARLNGEDTKLLERHSYELNEYGYGAKEIEA